MKFFLDTDTCIYFLKGRYPALQEHVARRHPDDIRIPAMVKAELLLGALKSQDPAAMLDKVNHFLLPYQITGFDDTAAAVYARIRADLERRGSVIGPNDLIIAAIVATNEGTLVTGNEAEFKRVAGLKVANWTI